VPGCSLRPLALGPVEQRFARGFPGRIVRLTDERQVLVWREVQRPTRMLHPAADCFRGLGYRIAAMRLEHDAQQRLWHCFAAERGDLGRLRIGHELRHAIDVVAMQAPVGREHADARRTLESTLDDHQPATVVSGLVEFAFGARGASTPNLGSIGTVTSCWG